MGRLLGVAMGSRGWRCTDQDVDQALNALDVAPLRVRATAWPGELNDLDEPGLYSWWADASGAKALSAGLDEVVPVGRIYAGQTGATKWPSGRRGAMTLRKRLGSNHLRGSIYGSTFRRTLAACLYTSLGLQPIAPGKLEPASERKLSEWMRDHLEVAIHPFTDRDALGDLEARVLAVLNPPLNLHGMPPNPRRERLSRLRGQLGGAAELAPGPPALADAGERLPRSGAGRVATSGHVTLHAEIAEILRETGGWTSTKEIAQAVNARGRYEKRDGSAVTAFQIHGRTRSYPHLFERDGASVRLITPRR